MSIAKIIAKVVEFLSVINRNLHSYNELEDIIELLRKEQEKRVIVESKNLVSAYHNELEYHNAYKTSDNIHNDYAANLEQKIRLVNNFITNLKNLR